MMALEDRCGCGMDVRRWERQIAPAVDQAPPGGWRRPARCAPCPPPAGPLAFAVVWGHRPRAELGGGEAGRSPALPLHACALDAAPNRVGQPLGTVHDRGRGRQRRTRGWLPTTRSPPPAPAPARLAGMLLRHAPWTRPAWPTTCPPSLAAPTWTPSTWCCWAAPAPAPAPAAWWTTRARRRRPTAPPPTRRPPSRTTRAWTTAPTTCPRPSSASSSAPSRPPPCG